MKKQKKKTVIKLKKSKLSFFNTRKIVSAFTAMMLASTVLGSNGLTVVADQNHTDTTAPNHEEYIYWLGDSNGDDVIDLNDAKVTLKAALKIINLDYMADIADVDKDGTVDLNDAKETLKVALKITQLKELRQCSKIPCTVTFESNGGSVIDPVKVNKGSVVAEPTKPVKEGYAFAGWYVDKNYEEMFLFDEDVVSGNITLYADWIGENKDANIVEYAASQLAIGYQTGDSEKAVMNDLTLPSSIEGVDDVAITWNSSMSDIISENGVVTRPADNDASVTLTATVSNGTKSKDVTFPIIVIHEKTRDASDITNQSVIDIKNMNNGNAEVIFNEDKNQVTSITGQYSDILVKNTDDALDSIQSIHTIVGIDNPYEELEIETTNSDEYGAEYRFKQTYEGYEVYGRSVTVSVDEDGKTDSLSSGVCLSDYVESTDTRPEIDQSEAENIAVNAETGEVTADSISTKLVLYSLDEYASSPILTYYVVIDGTDEENNYFNKIVFVNANSGEIVNSVSEIQEDDSTKNASAKNELGDKVSFPVRFTWNDWYFYYMHDTDLKIQIYDREFDSIHRVGSEFNLWLDRQAVSAYTNMQTVIKWWKDTFNRNSLDDKGMPVNVIIHDSKYFDNAFWSPSEENIHICDTFLSVAKYSRAVATDVLTHETTHAVIQYIVGSSFSTWYQNAPGAINEGYADVFGCLNNQNWTHGESLYTSKSTYKGNTITSTRNIADPDDIHALTQGPDKLSSSYYIDYTKQEPNQDNDFNGVHTNTFLISHAAYLMYDYGMSWDVLEKLWYKSLSLGYDINSDFTTVRRNVLKAAEKIDLSEDEIKIIKKAFDKEEIYGDRGTLNGTIKDSEGNAVTDASIELYKDGAFVGIARPFDEGAFSTKINVGTYDMKIIADGYVEYNSVQTIEKDTNTDLAIILVKNGSGELNGTITSATTAKTLQDVTINVRSGQNNKTGEIISTVKTDSNGQYSLQLPAGYYTLELICDGYTTNYANATVIAETNVIDNESISPIMSSGKYRVVLTWGETPTDLDAHLKVSLSNQLPYNIYYLIKEAYDEDNNLIGELDVDDRNGYGPETVTFDADVTGKYEYYVYRYSSDGVLPASGANVKVYYGDMLVGNYDIDKTADSDCQFWNIFKIENGIFTLINTID